MTTHNIINLINNPDSNIEKLSNDYDSELNVNNVSYQSVSNFIYSNSIKNPEYSKKIKFSSPSKSRNEYVRYYLMEMNDTMNNSLEKGLLAKFENENMKQLLLETEHRPIIYINDNPHLGTGKRWKR